MTRLEKKCLVFSVGMHATLLGVLIASAAFRREPQIQSRLILTMIPANIIDGTAANIPGSPGQSAAAQLQTPAQPVAPTPRQAQRPPPRPTPPKEVAHQPVPDFTPVPQPRHRETTPEPDTKPLAAEGLTPRPHHRPTHEIHPTFETATTKPMKARAHPTPTQSSDTEQATEAAEAMAASAERRRLRAQIQHALGHLASNVTHAGAEGTVVDMPGQGGGAAFAGYETVIYNVYYHAWVAPESVANKLAAVDVKIVVSRSGNIVSSEIVNRSGDSGLDKSVERVLRAISHLPPFPASARDDQRSFLIRFNVDAKEGNG